MLGDGMFVTTFFYLVFFQNQILKFSDVWDNTYPSCTIDLERTTSGGGSAAAAGGDIADAHDVHCRVKAKQKKAPEEDLVHLSIHVSPEEVMYKHFE